MTTKFEKDSPQNDIISQTEITESGQIHTDKEKQTDKILSQTSQKIEKDKSLILQVSGNEVAIPYSEVGEFLTTHKDAVNWDYLQDTVKIYDGTPESIETIFAQIKQGGIQRLQELNVNANEIFWEEFKQLLAKLNDAFKGISEDKDNLIKLHLGSKLEKMYTKIRLWVQGTSLDDVMDKIKGTSSFAISTDSKIKEKTDQALAINEKSKEDFEYLVTNYSVQLVLKFLIEKELQKDNLDERTKLLLQKRLDGIGAELANIVLTLQMSQWASNQIDSTVISLNLSHEQLISGLNTLMTTVQSINTLSEINEIASILRNLKAVSIEQTAKWYQNLLQQAADQIEDEIGYHKQIQELIINSNKKEEQMKKEIAELEQKLKIEQQKTEAIGKEQLQKQNPKKLLKNDTKSDSNT